MSAVRWIRRQLGLLEVALASLLRRKVKNGGLLLVYALIVFTLTSVLFFAGALRREAVAVLAEAPEMVVQRLVTGRYAPIPHAYADTIAAIRGVAQVRQRHWGYYFHPAAKANFTVMVDTTKVPEPGRAVVGAGVLRVWPTAEAAQIWLRGADGQAMALTVAASLDATTELVSSDLILIHPDDFQRLFALPEQMASDLAVTIRNPREAATIAEKITTRLPDTRPLLREEIRRTYETVFDWRGGFLLVLLGGAVLAFFIFALDKATGLSAEERREIAILKAIGWDTGDVLLLKSYEGLAISLTAFLLGVGGAYLHVFAARSPLFEHALKGWGVLYPHFRLTPTVDLYQLAAVLGLTVLPYALITVVPAWRAAVTDPDAAMRQV